MEINHPAAEAEKSTTEGKNANALAMIRKFIVRVIQGAIIGAGAILPGISGAVPVGSEKVDLTAR